jgi:hypothetical protein
MPCCGTAVPLLHPSLCPRPDSDCPTWSPFSPFSSSRRAQASRRSLPAPRARQRWLRDRRPPEGEQQQQVLVATLHDSASSHVARSIVRHHVVLQVPQTCSPRLDVVLVVQLLRYVVLLLGVPNEIFPSRFLLPGIDHDQSQSPSPSRPHPLTCASSLTTFLRHSHDSFSGWSLPLGLSFPPHQPGSPPCHWRPRLTPDSY